MPENLDVLNLMLNDWFDTDNKFNVDFELYSTYADALSGNNRWTYCVLNNPRYGFPWDCGPSGKVTHNWNSYIYGGGRADHHAFFVEASPEFEYTSKDIAQFGTASQSTTGWGGEAKRALDGNSVGIYGWSTVTHTNWGKGSYWQVFLGAPATIDKVYIWNRLDCCRHRSVDYKVEVLDGINGGAVVATKTLPGYLPVMNVVDFEGVTGATVRITATKGTYSLLSLAEVQVTGELDKTKVIKNVAIGGVATQSSTIHGGVASRAIDGDTNGRWSGTSVTHTNGEQNPWWKLKLSEAHPVNMVSLYNRHDCCYYRLYKPIVELWKDGTLVKSIEHNTYAPKYGALTFSFGNIEADEVRVWMNINWRILSLAEVEVYSYVDTSAITEAPSASPSAGPTVAPSLSPSASPIADASETPSSKPSSAPVADASENPSSKPSSSPVADVSENPSSKPTASPVAGASENPSSKPTASPVAGASENPSAAPTNVDVTSAPTTVANVVVSLLEDYETATDEQLNNIVAALISKLDGIA